MCGASRGKSAFRRPLYMVDVSFLTQVTSTSIWPQAPFAPTCSSHSRSFFRNSGASGKNFSHFLPLTFFIVRVKRSTRCCAPLFILREIALRSCAGGGRGGGSGGEGRGQWGRNWGRICCGVGQSGIKWRHWLRNARITTNKGGVHGWAQWRISS